MKAQGSKGDAAFTRRKWCSERAACFSEFSKIVEELESKVLELENNCASYQRWSLVKVVSGRKEALTDGKGISGCSEIDVTELIRNSLPNAFLTGTVLSHSVSLKVQTTLDTCPEGDMAFFVAWNCSPST